MKTVAFVTCAEVGLVPDDRLIADELRGIGIEVTAVPWDDGEIPVVDAFVVRSPWNYHLQPDAFIAWIERAAAIAPVFNEPRTIRWNMHKAYLDDLAAAGVRGVPTVIVRRNESRDLAQIMNEREWHEVVVKPAISASSYMTARFTTGGQEHLEAILATRDALVQPFMPEIFTRGERSLVFFGGEYSHCVQKDAFTTAHGAGAAVEADEAEREIAQRALHVRSDVPLYARVDLLRDAHGAEHVMELELLDPELYVRFDRHAPRRFADALAASLS